MEELDLEIIQHDGNTSQLSSALVKKQGLNQNDVDKIKKLHNKKYDILLEMKETEDSAQLKLLSLDIEAVEFELQEAWGFPKDRNYHYWWQVPHCECDGRSGYGTLVSPINKNCKVHSNG
jgi:hypothetical protein